MPKGQILAYRRDRLGGRLRSMVNAMRLADWSDSAFRVLWPVGHYAQELAEPTEFFDADYVTSHFEFDQDTIKELYEGATHFGDFADYPAMLAHLEAGKNILVENSKGPLALPDETQEEADLAFIETAKRIKPSETVQAALDQFDSLVGDRLATALHVRRGDIIQPGRWSRTYWPTKYVPDEYYDVMIEDQTEAAYLLFSDTAETRARFEAVHGIRSAVDVLGLDSLTESQRDFAELLAISKCQTVLAASDSAFSSAATLLGGTTKISLPDEMPENVKVQAEQRLISRVEAGPEAFLNVYDFGQAAHRVTDVYQAQNEGDKAASIIRGIASQGLEIPHLTRDYLHEAILHNDDRSCLSIMIGEQETRKVRRWHVDHPGLLKHHLRRQVIATMAYAGLGMDDLAAKHVSNLGLLQTKVSPLDILSVHLSDQLTDGSNGVPPTTLIPFGDDQIHPRGLPSIAGFNDHWAARFLGGRRPMNWQAAFDLDWRMIGVNERPGPREPLLRYVLQTGRSSEDPMQVSLAALAALRLGLIGRAKNLMRRAEQMPKPPLGLKQALIWKRRAQIAEALDNQSTAHETQLEAIAASDHPAFLAYYLSYLSRHKQRGDAREIVAECTDRPFYISWLRYELLAREKDSSWDREQLGQECLDHWTVTLPDASDTGTVSLPTKVA